jgi:ADP-ribose pyrophosphatase
VNPRDGRLMCRDDRGEIRLATLRGRDGSETERLFVIHGGSVVMVPVTQSGELILIQNRRPGVGETLWELCAGTLDPDEEPKLGAVRELREETGYLAGRMEAIGGFYATPGFSTEYLHVFVATELSHVGQELDPTEEITPVAMSLERVRGMMGGEGLDASEQIRDAKTLAALALYFARGVRG